MDDVSRHLQQGERIVWEGRPGGGLILRPIEIFLIPFSLFWGGFALFWNLPVWGFGGFETAGAPLPFKLFGLPFLLAGLYVIAGRFWIDVQLRRKLRYVVTDRRILILKAGIGSNIKSLDIKRLPVLELQEMTDGSGTIRFGQAANWFNGANFGIWQPALDPTPQFLRIREAQAVYQLIQQQS